MTKKSTHSNNEQNSIESFVPKFKVGDVCILINTERHPEIEGQTVTVIENFGWQEPEGVDPFFGYRLDIQVDGCSIVAKQYQLKKKPLPRNFKKKVSWDSVGWSPYTEKSLVIAGACKHE